MKIILIGATGQMGQVISEICKDSDMKIVAGVGRQNLEADYPIYDNFDIKEEADIIIDFSTKDLLDDVLKLAKDKNIPAVLATTGYDEEDIKKIHKASEDIALIYERNYSLGINIMHKISKEIAKALKEFDIEIIEKHHRYKADSPSGTAIYLFEGVNEARDNKLFRNDGRAGFDKDGRNKNEIGISSIRGGTVVGEHSVNFYGEDEVLELTHEAGSKKLFANGALTASKFLIDQKPGLYNLDDVLYN